MRQVDDAHGPLAEHREQFELAEPHPELRFAGELVDRRLFEERVLPVGGEQAFDLVHQVLVFAAFASEERGPLGGGQFARATMQVANALPPFRVHRPSSRRNQSRAVFQ